MSINLSQLNLDPMAMIYHYDRLFANFRLDLYTVYHHLAKINARVYSVKKQTLRIVDQLRIRPKSIAFHLPLQD